MKLRFIFLFSLMVISFIPLDSLIPKAYALTATGGTITYSGGYTIHTFTTSGTFTVTGSGNVQYLVIAGGGGAIVGGGGAGGYSNGTLAVTTQAYGITVGAGGAAGAGGGSSIFSSITSTGGGIGGAVNGDGGAGGSGGGGGGSLSNHPGGAGTGGQGNNGGTNPGTASPFGSAGGGGAGAVGADTVSNVVGGAGGNGLSSSITGSAVTRAGGGGGSVINGGGTGGAGGSGGGGAGTGTTINDIGTAGTANTGSGGGGGGNTGTGGAGGSGIVIIRYLPTNSPYAVTDLTSTSLGQTTATLDWSQPYLGGGNQALIGYQINVTTPQTNNPLVYTNNTGSSNSFANLSGLTLGTSYSAIVSAWTNVTNGHPLNNATGNVYNFTTNTYTPPSAPTLSALSESETSVRFTSVNGTTGQFNMFYYGLRCVENSLGSWVTIVSNSTTPSPRVYSYTLSPGDSVTCQWRDGSFAGFGAWSNNATDTTGQLGIIQAPRGANDDQLMNFATWIDNEGGLYFGLGVFPMVIMLIGFMATKGTVRIFTLISLMAMGILHGSGYFVYPAWYWALAILFGIVLVLGRQARD